MVENWACADDCTHPSHRRADQVEAKTPGQIAYEADVAARPFYQDGARRRSWSELEPIIKGTWERNATPRWTVEAPR